MKEHALEMLNGMKGSKMSNLIHNKLEVQEYLKSHKVSVSAAKILFKWRTRAAKFKDNYKGSYLFPTCPYCLIHMDTQAHSFQCNEMRNSVKIEGKYEEIFKREIPQEVINTIVRISKHREDIL